MIFSSSLQRSEQSSNLTQDKIFCYDLESLQKKVKDLPSGALFFIPSPTNPYALEKLLPLIAEPSFFLFFEKEASLMTRSVPVLEQLAAHPERFFWLSNDIEEEFRLLARHIPWNQIRRVLFFPISNSWMMHRSCYRTILHRIEEEWKVYWTNRATSLHLGPLWVRHTFRNLEENSRFFRPWPQWGSSLVVVAGAGASLEEFLKNPQPDRSQYKILAVDTALSCFSSVGLRPDAVVCLEAQQTNLKDFQDFFDTELPLFLDLTAHPSSAKLLKGPVYPFVSAFAEVNLVKRLKDLGISQVPALGSVGVAAVFLALQLTQGPVVLVGLDFAFPSGKTHAKGAPFHREGLRKTNRFCSVELPGMWRKGALIEKESLLSTTVLLGYAKTLTGLLLNEKQRCFSISCNELLPIVQKKSIEEALSEVSSGASQAHPPYGQQKLSSIKNFLSDEEKRLHDFFNVLQRFHHHNHKTTELEQEQLFSAMQELDHLYFFYPDREPLPCLNKGFLSRFSLTARWHQKLIRRLQASSISSAEFANT